MALRLRKEMICGYKPLRLPAKVIYIVSKKKFLGKCDQEPDLNLELYKDNKAVTDLITQALGSEVEKLSLQFETMYNVPIMFLKQMTRQLKSVSMTAS